MKPTSSLFDSIRVGNKSSKKKKEEPVKQVCQWEGCEKPGTHKAPMGRNREGLYLWMCIEHVREYNKNFNYFSGLSDDEIAKYQKENITGHRPTWKMGTRKVEPVNESTLRATPGWHAKIQSRYTPDGKRIPTTGGPRKLKRLEEKALHDLGLPSTASSDHITKKYKDLVKQNHPDRIKGDRSSEQRLQQVLAAYKVLKKSGLC